MFVIVGLCVAVREVERKRERERESEREKESTNVNKLVIICLTLSKLCLPPKKWCTAFKWHLSQYSHPPSEEVESSVPLVHACRKMFGKVQCSKGRFLMRLTQQSAKQACIEGTTISSTQPSELYAVHSSWFVELEQIKMYYQQDSTQGKSVAFENVISMWPAGWSKYVKREQTMFSSTQLHQLSPIGKLSTSWAWDAVYAGYLS